MEDVGGSGRAEGDAGGDDEALAFFRDIMLNGEMHGLLHDGVEILRRKLIDALAREPLREFPFAVVRVKRTAALLLGGCATHTMTACVGDAETLGYRDGGLGRCVGRAGG